MQKDEIRVLFAALDVQIGPVTGNPINAQIAEPDQFVKITITDMFIMKLRLDRMTLVKVEAGCN